MIGMGEVCGCGCWGRGGDVNSILNTCFLMYCSLLGDFCTENIIFLKKEWSSTEQASNETVAKNSWRYLFANPDRYIYLTIIRRRRS